MVEIVNNTLNKSHILYIMLLHDEQGLFIKDSSMFTHYQTGSDVTNARRSSTSPLLPMLWFALIIASLTKLPVEVQKLVIFVVLYDALGNLVILLWKGSVCDLVSIGGNLFVLDTFKCWAVISFTSRLYSCCPSRIMKWNSAVLASTLPPWPVFTRTLVPNHIFKYHHMMLLTVSSGP